MCGAPLSHGKLQCWSGARLRLALPPLLPPPCPWLPACCCAPSLLRPLLAALPPCSRACARWRCAQVFYIGQVLLDGEGTGEVGVVRLPTEEERRMVKRSVIATVQMHFKRESEVYIWLRILIFEGKCSE